MRPKRLILSAAVLILVFGCGPKNKNAPAQLGGKVTYKGQPVGGGMITFYPKEGGGAYSTSLGGDGSYSVVDLPVGELQVTIETESMKGVNSAGAGGGRYAKSMGPKPEGAQAPAITGTYVKIPAKYARKETSGLNVKVEHGKGTRDFDLTD